MKKQITQLVIIATLSTGTALSSVPLFLSYALNKTLQHHDEGGNKTKSSFVTVEKDESDDDYLSSYKVTIDTKPLSHKIHEYSFYIPELAYYASVLTGIHTIKYAYSKASSVPKTAMQSFMRKNLQRTLIFTGCTSLFALYENVNEKLNWDENFTNFIQQEHERIVQNTERLNKQKDSNS